MIEIKTEGILLTKTDLGFETEGVLNPAVIREGEHVHLFYRAVREGNYSSIGYCKFLGPTNMIERHDIPIIFPQMEYESQGVEDPRIVKIDDLYYLTYTAFTGINALGALVTSKDLKHFEKQGLIVPQIDYEEFKHLAECQGQVHEKYFQGHILEIILKKLHEEIFMWDKNVIFFPRKIDNKFYFLHRIRPGIQLVSVNSLDELTKEFWANYFLHFNEHILLDPKHDHEASYIGGGCPPIETQHGWLLIYHGVRDTPRGFVYSACAALLDLQNPLKEISRLPQALFSPSYDWEIYGYVNNVVFPTGTALFGDTLYIYYGAADEQIACVSLSLTVLLSELLLNRKINEN
jgi:predicted GH43/DUF377 family glycosyl hydrolase